MPDCKLITALAVAAVLTIVATPSLVLAGKQRDIFENKPGFDGHKDLWYLEDGVVSRETAASRFEKLLLTPFSHADHLELHHNFVLAQQTPKKVGHMDDRWDVRVYKQFQMFALYDGINAPSVVNRLRSTLLRELGNAVYEDLEALDASFVAAKNGGAEAMAVYLDKKIAVFKKISDKIQEVEFYNRQGNSNSAAAGAVAIVSPNFVIVAQVGSVHVLSYRHLTPISLTVDQTRDGPDGANFALADCKNYFEQELCLHTRVFGAAGAKEVKSGRPTHTSQPFIKLYKRVYAPYLNDNDFVLGANSFKSGHLFDVEAATGSEIDTASLPVVQPDLNVDADDELAIRDTLEDLNDLKYLLITTHPIRRYLNPANIARIVAQNMHDAFKREAGTVKSIMTATLREIIETAKNPEGEGWTGFVNSFFSDVTALYVPLVLEPERYHY